MYKYKYSFTSMYYNIIAVDSWRILRSAVACVHDVLKGDFHLSRGETLKYIKIPGEITAWEMV